jgi:RNA-directed DNA polymerase
MTQQKSEDRIVPEGRRKSVSTRGVEPFGGGKAIPVSERVQQLGLFTATAENLGATPGLDGGAEAGGPASEPYAGPKAVGHEETGAPATMKRVIAKLNSAFEQVASNKGAPGPDGQTVEDARERLHEWLPALATALDDGSYRPGNIRRVEIPKPGGGKRGLGIPNVVDRVVQQAIRMALEPLYEPQFHPSSHGFRPGRSCHTAIAEAKAYLEDGHEWVVDIDLEKFFDRVCHQRLMSRLEQRVSDRQLLCLIRRLLKAAVVMPDGVVVSTDEGVPQGGPLSPLLSNIVLDELDWELERRGHRFVRYADDCNVYVGSERGGQRVMDSLTRFIEGRLRLKVNAKKSAVARPGDRHFLGFSLRVDPQDGGVEVLLSERSWKRAAQQVRELTPRNWGSSLRACIDRVNAYTSGWFNFFGICTATEAKDLKFGTLDAHIRRRLRAIQLKHWKRKHIIATNLIRKGVRPKTAWRTVYEGRKSLWTLSHTPVVNRALSNAYFAERGLDSLLGRWRAKHFPVVAPKRQLSLPWG